MTALVFGGSGSGKSTYGEALAQSLAGSGPLIYLATMEPAGREADGRIARHRAQRAGKGFLTVERSRDLGACLIPEGATVLLEDLGNWAANELFSPGQPTWEQTYEHMRKVLKTLMRKARNLVVISVDIHRDGGTYPPETEYYLSLLAALHKDLGAWCDQVTEVVCGIPVIWKGEPI